MNTLRSAIKIVLWIILAVVLLVAGLLVGVSRYFGPERLTPLVCTMANKALDADIEIGSAELSLRQSFPFLNLEVSDLAVISRRMQALASAERDSLPQWADTLLRVDGFSGGINLAKLMVGKIDLSDVEVRRPQLNLVVAADSLANYDIVKAGEEDDQDGDAAMPDISIRRFSIISPAVARYHSVPDTLSLAVHIDSACLDNSCQSAYRLGVATNIESPLLAMLQAERMPVRFNGDIEWSHEHAMEMNFKNFEFSAGLLSGRFSAWVDFAPGCLARELDFTLSPLTVADVLAMLPPAEAAYMGIPAGIVTDASVEIAGRLTGAYDAASADIPHGIVTVKVEPCMLKCGQIDFRRLALDCDIALAGNNIDSAVVDVRKLTIAGPATTLDIAGRASGLMSDPAFDGKITGNVNFDRLPAQLLAMLPPGSLKGRMKLDTQMKGSVSMFDTNNFHRLYVKGTIDLNNLYFVSADTLTMVQAGAAHAKFGTSESVSSSLVSRRDSSVITVKADSLLTAAISVDSAQMLVSGLAMRIAGFKIGIGAQNKALSGDTTDIIPVGGKISASMFSLFTLSDTAGVRIRDFGGNVSMRRYKGDRHLPLFVLDAALGRISAGDNSTRMMISDASLKARMHRLPDTLLSPYRRRLKATVDSLRRSRPELPVDSVYVLAQRIRERHSTGRHRVHAELDSSDREVMDWGASRGFKRLLLDWSLRGTLRARQAQLFTASFPVRNRVENINLAFSNDSIVLQNVAYKAGHSDFLISGTVSNMKRAFTSTRSNRSIKIEFDTESDTIDVNQLAQAFFVGAAHKDERLAGTVADDNDSMMADHGQSSAADEGTGPFLIPINIDAEFNMKARNVLYSDIELHNLNGSVLAYDGALNLRDLSASSDVGSIALSGLYSAPAVKDMKFGMSLALNDFRIKKFLELVPAVDSVMPLMRDLGGIVKANIVATADVDAEMNLVMPTLDAAINLVGDSLVVLDPETFKTISKWLMFKNKNKNMINHMSVDMVVANNRMQVFPFMFDFDRYRLGVQGTNDLDMNYDYHVSVLKSPLPFKFGINIRGNADDYKISFGKARFNEKQAVRSVAITDTARVNLIKQFENIFKRGVRKSRFAKLEIAAKPIAAEIDLASDTLTQADSLYLMQQGLIPGKETIYKK